MIESFSPLLGVDLTFRNSMQLRAQYNRDRMLSLSTTNYTYTEDYGSEYIVGFGYILDGNAHVLNINYNINYRNQILKLIIYFSLQAHSLYLLR